MAQRQHSGPAKIAALLGIAAHLATIFLYLLSGLVAPAAGVLFLLAGWVVLLVAAIRLRPYRPWLVATTPVVSIVFWVAVLLFGDYVLGWTA